MIKIKSLHRKFKSADSKSKTSLAIVIVNEFLNTVRFTKEINENTYNLKMAAEFILLNEMKNGCMIKAYNKVCTMVYNSFHDYEKIKSDLLSNPIIDNKYIGEYFIHGNYDSLLSTNPGDFFLIYNSNNFYIVLDAEHVADNSDVGDIIKNNIFNNSSVIVPLSKKCYELTKTLNGKDWVKEYALKNNTGYLYFIKFLKNNKQFHKVGISKSKDRFKNEHIIILEQHFIEMDMFSAAVKEQYIHIVNTNKRVFSDDLDDFGGKNECYHVDLYNKYKKLDLNECLDTVSTFSGYDTIMLKYIVEMKGL